MRISKPLCILLALLLITASLSATVFAEDISLAIVRGVVLTPDGTPFIKGPENWCNIQLETTDGVFIAGSSTDDQGQYIIEANILAGNYRLSVHTGGYNNPYTNPQPIPVTIESGMPLILDIVLVNTKLTGKVLTPGGDAFIPGEGSWSYVFLTALSDGRQVAGTGLESDGSFRLGGDIPSGDYWLNANADGDLNPYSNAAPVPIQINANQVTVMNISLTIPVISGRVLAPDGNPLFQDGTTWAKVHLERPDGQFVAFSGIAGNGQFKLGGNIPAGSYILRAYCGGSGNPYSNSLPIEIVVADQPLFQDIYLTVPVLKGTVYNPYGGIFLPGYEIWGAVVLKDPNDANKNIAWINVDNDGTYRIGPGIPSGDYKLYVHAAGNDNPYTDSIPVTVHIEEGSTQTLDLALTYPVILGTIYTPDGTVFQPGNERWANISLRDSENREVAWADVNNNGTYRMGGEIPPGSYVMCLAAGGINNPFTGPQPIPVELSAGQSITCNFTLITPAIKGIVRAPDGSPFIQSENSWAYIFLTRASDNQYVSGTGVENDGSFKLGGDIPSGDYWLNANADGSLNPYSNAVPMLVHVTDGSALYQDITLQLPLLQGHVYTPDGSLFIPADESGVHIYITRSSDGEYVAGTGVRDDGSFRLGGNIPTGDYMVNASADGVNNPYCSIKPVPIHLTEGLLTDFDISLPTPAVVGRVLTPDGELIVPCEDFWYKISIQDSSGNWVGHPQNYNTGIFKIGRDLPPDNYTLYTECGGSNNPYTDAMPVNVQIQDGLTQNIDIRLTIPQVQGFVLKPDGSVFIPEEEKWTDVYLIRESDGQWFDGTGVNNDGSFRLGGYLPEGDYLLHADTNGTNNEFTNAQPVLLHVKPGMTITQSISLTNPIIVGYILKPDGTPFIQDESTWAKVHLETMDGQFIAFSGVDSSGRFRLGGSIPAGDYILRAFTGGNGNPFCNALPLKISILEGQPLPLEQNISLTNPVITGKILKPDGSALHLEGDMWVNVALDNLSFNQVAEGNVSPDGSYRVGGSIQPGIYLLRAFPGGSSCPYAQSLAVKIIIEEGKLFNQDLQLTYPLVTGKVLAPDGSPLPLNNEFWSEVVLLDPSNTFTRFNGTRTDNDGSYRMAGEILPGNYLLIALEGGNNNPYTNSSPVNINITPEGTIVQDLMLGTPLVTGRVLTPEGNVVTKEMETFVNISLRSTSEIKTVFAWGEMREDGTFTMGGNVPTGDYLLYVEATSNKFNYTGPEPVLVHIQQGSILDTDITLSYPNSSPNLELIGFKTVEAGQPLEFQVDAFDFEGDSLNFSASNLPQGALFNAESRTFSWIPEESQKGIFYGIKFAVSDAKNTDFEVIKITVTSGTVTPPPAPDPSSQEEFTTDEDFDKGVLKGVEHETVPDQMQLSKDVSTLPFIWVPNSNGTVSKINTESGDELGRYRIAPANLPTFGDPSRTTVDLDGNCWVGNRGAGTVTKIGLLENGQWIDRNGDGICQTSRDLDRNGYITPDEVLDWGQDECVLFEVVLIPGNVGTYVPGEYTGPYDTNSKDGTAPRGLAIDADNNIWVGTSGTQTYFYIDGESGSIIKQIDVSPWNHFAYGAVIDENGVLWSVNSHYSNVLRFDPSTNTIDVINIPYGVYGIGLDYIGHLFVTGFGGNVLTRIDIHTGNIDWTKKSEGLNMSRGVVCTRDNRVFVANSGGNSVTAYNNDGDLLAVIPVGRTPSGVAVASDGKIWVCDIADEKIFRIDPDSYSVDFSKTIIDSWGHYTYSDMTGILSRTITTSTGAWTIIRDGGADDAAWGIVSWNSYEPEGTSIEVYARTSNDLQNWSPMVPAVNGAQLVGVPDGRYIMVDTVFKVASGNTSPVLYDMKIVNIQKFAPTEIIAKDSSCEYSDPATLSAVLTSHGIPVAGKLLDFNVNGTYVGSAWTSDDGKAVTDFNVDLPAGSYTITVSFSQDEADKLLSSEGTAKLTVAPEKAAIMYTGQHLVQYPGKIQLAAKVSQETDGTPGDLKLARVRFTVSIVNSSGNIEPVGEYDAACNDLGETIVNVPLGIGVYNITASIIEEGWYTPDTDTAIAPVYDPAGGFATGGGWVNVTDTLDGNLGRANFGFIAKYKDNRSTGNLEFQYKDGNIDLKGSQIDWLVISTNSGQFQGTGTIQGWEGLYTFRVSFTDNEGKLLPDKFTIKIWSGTDTESEPIYKALNQNLQGGNILVKTK